MYMKTLNKGHLGDIKSVLYSEVAPYSQVVVWGRTKCPYLEGPLLEECNALLAGEHEQFNISCVFCAYLESRRTLWYVRCPTEPSHT